MTKKTVYLLNALVIGSLAGTAFSFSAAAVERANIWVHEIEQQQGAVSLTKSTQANELRAALVQPWVSALPSGTRLTQKSGAITHLPLLQVPLATERFTQGKITVAGAEKVTFYINGEVVKSTGLSADLALRTGDHQLLVLIEEAKDWGALDVTWQGKADHDVLDTSQPKALRLSQEQMFDPVSTTLVEASPDGKYIVWRKQHYTAATGNKAQVDLQIYDVQGQRTLYRWGAGNAHSFAWSKNSQELAFIQANRVHVLNINNLALTPLTNELKGVGGVQWLNANTLIFSWNKSGEQDGTMVKHYRALEDRWSYYRDNSQLHTLNTKNKAIYQVTEGNSSIRLHSIHDDGERILVSQGIIDYREPAHSKSALRELNVKTGVVVELGEHRTLNRAVYVGNDIYVVAGAEFGNGAGRHLPEGWLANNYDGQLYQLQRDGKVKALSRTFDPAIGGIEALANGNLLVTVTERDTTQLYHYRVRQADFQRIPTGLDVVDRFSASQEKVPTIYFSGSEVTAPDRLARLALNQKKPTVIWDSASAYAHNKIHDIREWNFKNAKGDTIYGRVYVPPGLDTKKKYPALVYYYGGTTPVQRGFTGRYPFNQWAAQGYVVYVVQPSGATGFGQKFSAMHVNAWGGDTASDIIDGTKQFLAAHDFVDAKRVGHLGASYGGFMTMLLATQTDIFSASMSHAGISNLTSYWGEGWWGFLYSGEASKGSFPWNNAKLYTEHSPVYHADKVTAPMLLIHGDSDTNVPPGESQTMYTALKLLGKEVELVEFKGADHHIIPRDARFHWWDTYMAFFDKHLKDEPQWWDYLYPAQADDKR